MAEPQFLSPGGVLPAGTSDAAVSTAAATVTATRTVPAKKTSSFQVVIDVARNGPRPEASAPRVLHESESVLRDERHVVLP
jgi:hypothetical protein